MLTWYQGRLWNPLVMKNAISWSESECYQSESCEPKTWSNSNKNSIYLSRFFVVILILKITFMHVNNKTHMIQTFCKVCTTCRKAGIWMHWWMFGEKHWDTDKAYASFANNQNVWAVQALLSLKFWKLSKKNFGQNLFFDRWVSFLTFFTRLCYFKYIMHIFALIVVIPFLYC